jgi:excisionase family DNA binding protein
MGTDDVQNKGSRMVTGQAVVKEIMDVRELTDYLGIGKSKIYSLIRNKKIPASKIGRQYRFSREIIDNWLKERIITGKEEMQIGLFDANKPPKNPPEA